MSQTNQSESFEHDVAFSFLAQDLNAANQFADALRPLSVFVYAQKQQELAGTNGLESFRAAFRYNSRLNVILLRQGWGGTPWTRVEEAAIQGRCLKDGWDRLLVVNLDGSKPPTWIPEVDIFLDLSTFPLDQAAGAIKRQVQQLGGKVQRPSAVDNARRTVAAAEFAEETKKFFWSLEGIRSADDSVKWIVDQLASAAGAVSGSKYPVAHGLHHGYGVVRMGEASALFNWERSGNTCHECPLKIRVFDSPFETPEEQQRGALFIRFEKSRVSWRETFLVDRDQVLGVCWKSAGKTFSSDEVVDATLGHLVEIATRK